METNYTLKNLIRGGTLLLFFLAFMLTGPQSVEAQEEAVRSVTLEVEIDSPPGAELWVYTSTQDYQEFEGPGVAEITVSPAQVIYFNVVSNTCIGLDEWVDVGDGKPQTYTGSLPNRNFRYVMPAAGGASLKVVYENVGYLLTADVNDTDFGTVAIDGGDALGTATATIACTDQFEVVATATPGYTFDHFVVVGGDIAGTYDENDDDLSGVGTGQGTLALDMPDVPVTVTAHFVQYFLTTDPVGGGTVSTTIGASEMGAVPGYGVTAGTPVSVEAKANTDWIFTEWTGTYTGTATTLSFNMPAADVAVAANFTQIRTLEVDVNMAAGTANIVGGQTTSTFYVFDNNNVFDIEATVVSPGYTFVNWTAVPGGVIIDDPTSKQTKVTLPNADATVTANFVGSVTLTINKVGNGTVQPIGEFVDVYYDGQEVVISADADPGWTLDAWAFDGVVVDGSDGTDTGSGTATITMQATAGTVTATFVNYSYAEEKTGEGAGTITVEPDAANIDGNDITAGTVFEVKWEADLGHTLVGADVIDAGGPIAPIAFGPYDGRTVTATFTMPAGNVTITAQFEKYAVNVVQIEPADGTFSIEGDGYHNGFATEGTTLTVTFTAEEGSTLIGIVNTEDPAADNNIAADFTSGTSFFTMPGGPVTITATYANYAVDVVQNDDADGVPSVVGDNYREPNATEGSTVTVSFTVNPGATLDNITTDPLVGAVIDHTFTEGYASFDMPANTVTVTADYNRNEVILVDNGDGTSEIVAVEGNYYDDSGTNWTVTAGKTVTLTATADNPSTFIDFTVLGVATYTYSGYNTPQGTLSFVMPNGTVTVTANYDELILTTATDPSGAGTALIEVEAGEVYFDELAVQEGDDATIIASAYTGWRFIKWRSEPNYNANIGSLTSTTTTFTMPGDDVTLIAEFKQTRRLTTNVEPAAAGTIDPQYTNEAVIIGDHVDFEAVAAAGYTFNGFTVVDNTGTYTNTTYLGVDLSDVGQGTKTGTMAFDMPNRNVTVTANFVQYQVVLAKAGSGTGVVSIDDVTTTPQYFTAGEEITVYAVADANHTLIDIDGNAKGPATGTFTFVMPANNVTVTTTFEEFLLVYEDFDLDGNMLIADGVNPFGAPVRTGTEVVMTATAATGWTFVDFDGLPGGALIDGELSGVGTATLTMPASTVTVTANFDQYKVAVKTDPVGAAVVYVDDPGTISKAITANEDIVYTVVLGDITEGYVFVDWTPGNITAETFTNTMTPGTVTYTANFTEKDYPLTIAKIGDGDVTPYVGTQSQTFNDLITVTAEADSGWLFDGWEFENIPAANLVSGHNDSGVISSTLEFEMPNNAATVTARFVEGDGAIVELGPQQICMTAGQESNLLQYTAGSDIGLDFVAWEWTINGGRFLVVGGNQTQFEEVAHIRWAAIEENKVGEDDDIWIQVTAYETVGGTPYVSEKYYVDLFVKIDDIDITEPAAEVCSGVTAEFVVNTITPTGAYNGVFSDAGVSTMTYSGPGTVTITASPDGKTFFATAVDPGTYTLTYSAINGACVKEVDVFFTVSGFLVDLDITDGSAVTLCYDEEFEFTATPAFNDPLLDSDDAVYSWSVTPAGAGVEIDDNELTFTAVGVDTPTQYVVEVTAEDDCGKVATASTTITVNPTPLFDGIDVSGLCFDADVTAELDNPQHIIGAFSPTYTWVLSGDGVGTETSTVANFGLLPAGTYTVTVTVVHEAFPACETTYAVGFSVIPEPVIYFAFDGTVITTGETIEVCYDEDALFIIDNAIGKQPFYVTYTVDGGNGIDIVVDDQTEMTVADLVGSMDAGTYEIELTSIADADGCAVNNPEDFYNFTIEINPEPVLYFAFDGDVIEPQATIKVAEDTDKLFSLDDAVGEYPFTIDYSVQFGTATPTTYEDQVISTSTWTMSVVELLTGSVTGTLTLGDYHIELTSITDDNGCQVNVPTNTYTFTVSVVEEPAVGFAFNGVLADTDDVFTYCFNETVTVTLAEVWFGDAPFEIEWKYTVGTATFTGTATNVFVDDVLFTGILDPETYDIEITSITDANGFEADVTPYRAQVFVAAEPVAEITAAGDAENVCYGLSLELTLVDVNNAFGGVYTVTWMVDGMPVDDVHGKEFTFAPADFGDVGEYLEHTITAHVISEFECEYTTDPLVLTIDQLPVITKNVILDPPYTAFCTAIPEGTTIFPDGEVEWTYEGEQDEGEFTPMYRWQRSNNDGQTWVNIGATERVLTLGLTSQTTWYRRQVKLDFDFCGGPASMPWHSSNIVKLIVLEEPIDIDAIADVKDNDAVCFDTDATIELEANEPAIYLEGTWTGPEGVTFDDIHAFDAVVTADAPGAYTLTWTVELADNVFGCGEAMNSDDIVVVFESLEVAELDINGDDPICQSAAPVAIDVDALVTIVPVGGTYSYVLSGNGIVGDTFDPAIAGAGDHTLELEVTSDLTGCVGTVTTVVTVLEEPFVYFAFNGETAVPDSEFEYCYDEEIVVTLSGVDAGDFPFTVIYEINGVEADPVDITAIDGELFSDVMEAGTYTIVVTSIVDGNGCAIPAAVLDAVYKATVVVIGQIDAPVTTPVVVDFDEQLHGFDVEDAPAGYELVHKLDADDDWAYGDLPEYSAIGEYSVYVAYERIAEPNCLSAIGVATLTIVTPEPLDYSEIDDIAVTGKSAYITWTEGDIDQWWYSLDGAGWVTTTATSVFFDGLDFETEYTFELRMEGNFGEVEIVSEDFTTMYRGDVNKDNVVNILDVTTRIIPYINNTLPDNVDIIGDARDFTDNLEVFVWDAADVNNDSIINVQDIVITVNIALEFVPPRTTSNPADIYMQNNVVRLDSDGTLAGIQFELEGYDLNDVDLVAIPEGYQITWRVDDNILTGILFSLNNKPISEGMLDLFRIEGGQVIEWGDVYAANLAGDRVNVDAYDIPTDLPSFDESIVSLDVYPNPSSGQFTSRFEVPQNSMVELRLYDLSGRQVAVRQVEASGAATESWELDLQPGMYILRMAATPEGQPELSVTREVRVLIN